MRNLAHLAARLYNAPLMIQPAVADTFAAVFAQALGERGVVQLDAVAARPEPEAFAGNVRAGAKFEGKPYLVTEQGVAVLPIYGALLQRAGQFDANCMPMASYQRIGARFEAMLADPDVKGVLLEVDSPGGEVAGNFELARRMLARRDAGKPVWGHANESAFSAAYSLIASTARISVPQAGSVGSIGVVMLHMDQSERDRKQGVTYTPIYAGARKVDFNSHAPLSAEALAAGQAEVDRLYDMFIGHVATARSLDQQIVRGTEAGILAASDARQLGLVDVVQGFDETLQELTAAVSAPRSTTFLPGSNATSQPTKKGETEMSQTNEGTPVSEAEAQRRERAAADAATRQAAGAERTRISAILGHAEAAGRTPLAHKLAFETDMSAESAVTILQAAAKDAPAAAAPVPAPAAVSPLAAAMASVPNPPVAAGAAGVVDDSPAALAAAAVAAHNTFTRGSAK